MMLSIFSGCSMSKKIANERQAMLEAISSEKAHVSNEDIEQLPPVVQKWLRNSGAAQSDYVHTAFVKQKVWMKLKPEQEDWHEGTADQLFTVDKPAFNWRLKMKMSPIINVKGRDKFVDGKGEMKIKMNSLFNLANEKGSKIDEGALQRFLGEIIWFPTAATSPLIQWEQVNSLTAKATLSYKGTKGSGTFHFNQNGDLIKYTAMRYKGNEPESKRYLWINEVTDYRVFNGIKMPSKVNVTWQLDDGPWNWLKLEVTNVRYNTNELLNN